MEYGRKESPKQTSGLQTDSLKSTSGPNLTFVQKPIDNPQSCIVQRQINGNTAKMLVVLPNRQQRLITFDIPNEECTVQDLLEQANISFGPDTDVSLVTDQTFQINFVVEIGQGPFSGSGEGSEQSNTNLFLDEMDTILGEFTTFLSPTKKSGNYSLTQQAAPKYLDGELAFHKCGEIKSTNVNYFQREETELSNDCKNVPAMMAVDAIKKKMLLLNNYYNKSLIDHRRSAKMYRDRSTPLYGRRLHHLSSTGEAFSTKPIPSTYEEEQSSLTMKN
ncbi:uncharacterized protein LOC107224531 isoform X1 [Neodiprion lecontei]|uniref:Uncharacterized protein LOC107224531 isoform X1 n=1 Tax=Neodiprion lecontei TaxID=441921 RepID=A0A6J0C0P0_NEOLC|nr:uncharacterized protein LOC107224531 isoform X1 [Neodiprion lecontei]XP_046586146.1 uncharacterized protein LOC107224531 isoform X1 [Neodiprion lecontei]XP_046586156.1 uncharacterized protein LOC107224531 isoform X1 [Neodiprion lecontei]